MYYQYTFFHLSVSTNMMRTFFHIVLTAFPLQPGVSDRNHKSFATIDKAMAIFDWKHHSHGCTLELARTIFLSEHIPPAYIKGKQNA